MKRNLLFNRKAILFMSSLMIVLLSLTFGVFESNSQQSFGDVYKPEVCELSGRPGVKCDLVDPQGICDRLVKCHDPIIE